MKGHRRIEGKRIHTNAMHEGRSNDVIFNRRGMGSIVRPTEHNTQGKRIGPIIRAPGDNTRILVLFYELGPQESTKCLKYLCYLPFLCHVKIYSK